MENTEKTNTEKTAENRQNEIIARNMENHLTDYATAVNWCGNDYVLLNNILEIDPELDLCWTRDDDDTETLEREALREDAMGEIFQFFVSDMSEADAKFLRKTFGLLIAYSPRLECFVLCVDHYGTNWRLVPCEVFDNDFWASNGKEIVLKF